MQQEGFNCEGRVLKQSLCTYASMTLVCYSNVQDYLFGNQLKVGCNW